MRVEPFSLPLASPLSTAAGDISERRGFLVGVEAEREGDVVRGIGEATPLPGWTESYEECRRALERGPDDRPAGAGDSNDPAMLDTPAASHGKQLARLDLQARARDEPLAATLARTTGVQGAPAESVPVNATVGDADVDATVEAAVRAVDAGFDCLKLKVGARSLAEDVERVDAVLDVTDAALRLDANGAWDVPTADRAVRAFAERDVDYLEQPLPAGDLDGLASLRGRGVDVAVDESVGREGVEAVLRFDAADVAVLKPMTLGGPATALAVAGRLRTAGVDPVFTTTVDGAVARAAAVHAAACVPDVRPCGLATGALLADDLGPGPDPVPVEDGQIRVPDGPGTCGDRFDDLLWG